MFLKQFFWKLFLSLVLLIAIVSILFGVLLYRYIRGATLESLKENLKKETVMLGELISSDPDLLNDPRNLIQIVSTDDRLTVMSTDGTVLADNWAVRIGKIEIENHADRPEFQAALTGRPIYVQRLSETVAREMLYYAIPVKIDGRVRYVLRFSFALTTLQDLMAQVRNFMITGALLAIFLTLPVAFLISRGITKQIEALRQGARSLARGDLAYKIAPQDTRELRELASDLNQMGMQLQEKILSLQSEHQRVETLLSKMVEGVVALDENGKAVFANTAFCKMVGLDPAKIQGRSFLEITRNNDLSEFITQLLSKGKVLSESREIPILTPEEEKTFAVQASRIAEDHPVGSMVLLVFHDITRIRRIEQIRKDFVANVSHELRTPLTALKGSTELLLDGAFMNPEECKKFLEIMDKQLQNIQNLVSDMLSLASAEDNRAPLRRERIAASSLMSDVLALMRPLIEKKDLALDIQLPGSEIFLSADTGQLSDAMINLLDNASKYSPEKSRIDLVVRKEARELIIEVKDNGPGIPSDQLPRIFERFYRIDKSRSRDIGGTGLGLAIVKHAIENHGGSVSVKSELGRGTTFTIHLPETLIELAP